MDKAEAEPVEAKTVVTDSNTTEKALAQNDPTTSEKEKTPSPKKQCKKHANTKGKKNSHSTKSKKKKKKLKKDESSDEDSSEYSSDSSSNSADSESESESDDETSDSDSPKSKRKNKKAKQKALKKAKQLKKLRRAKKRSSSSDEEDEDDDDDDDEESEDEVALKKAEQAAKVKATLLKKQLQLHEEEDMEDDDDSNDRLSSFRRIQAQVKRLELLNKRGQHLKISQDDLQRRRKNTHESSKESKKKTKAAIKKQKRKRASKVAFKRVDQLWDSTIHNYKLTETIDDPDVNEWDQYIFTVRRRFDWEHKYLETLVDIKSKPLKECLQHVMADVKGISLVGETPHIDPNMLFLYLEECRVYQKKLKAESKTAPKKKLKKAAVAKSDHLKILVRYLDKDYADTKKSLYPMLENNTITFDLLWALYKPNTIAYTSTYGDNDHPRAFKIDYAYKESAFMRGTWYSIEGKYLEYDGKQFGMGTMSAQVSQFQGARKISSLDCYPLKYHKDPEAAKTQLIERGKKFVALKGMNYRSHIGMAYLKRKRQVLKININGRVMVDPAIHRRINPNYQISTVKPDEDGDVINVDDDSDESCGCESDSSDNDIDERYTPSSSEDGPGEQKKKYRVVKDDSGEYIVQEIDPDEDSHETVVEKENLAGRKEDLGESFSDEELLIASPVALGFAFNEKLWLELTVSGISEVVWNEGAFDSLVLPENQKSIVKALVSSHAFHPSKSIDDIISGKGKGLVAVLHGPPGTGKTLTAEGIADYLKRPLYVVSAGDLGTDASRLEREFQNILDVAHAWGALLLLDEADVFLEKRSIQDVHRNSLVSIFLKLLEYFQGIIFLTTNRVETFDDAFVSRIHLSLRYGDLTQKAKKSVWKMFLDKVKNSEGMEVEGIGDNDIELLARRNLNGRQIKNLTRTAQALAVHEGKPLTLEHIKKVIDVAETFETDLKGGKGYEDAMRGMSICC